MLENGETQFKFAPIGLSVYSRLNHLEQTVSALQKNKLALNSELYIFSDAPKPGDEEKVSAVRKFIHTIEGFKKIHIFEREVNNRVANNRGGIKMLLEKFGKLIFIEEDAVCAPNFLEFMNDALNVYENDKRIFAISGFFPDINIPKDYQHDVLMVPRMNAWTFGIWKDRYEQIEMKCYPEMYSSIFYDVEKFKQYGKGGVIVYSQLYALSRNKVDGLDIRIDYSMFINGGMYTIRPAKSLVRPIGCDGSGEHWKGVSNRFDVDLNENPRKLKVTADVNPNKRIINHFKKFNDHMVPFHVKILLKLHPFGLYEPTLKLLRFFKRQVFNKVIQPSKGNK